MSDLIDRGMVLDKLREAENHAFGSFYSGLIKAHNIIADTPSAKPQPKRGKWLPTSDDNKKRCSECDVITLIAQYPFGEANFCPNCGAKMER